MTCLAEKLGVAGLGNFQDEESATARTEVCDS